MNRLFASFQRTSKEWKVNRKYFIQMMGTGALWNASYASIEKHVDKGPRAAVKPALWGAFFGGTIGFVLALDTIFKPRWPMASHLPAVFGVTAVTYVMHLWLENKRELARNK